MLAPPNTHTFTAKETVVLRAIGFLSGSDD
jgi:hypothetical protein